MPSDTTGGASSSSLSPDEAFAVLGNETRMEILQVLAAADGSLSFSQLRERVGMRDSGRFNYHLGEVVGHFVAKTGDGYELSQAGARVIEAVLSGAVTEAPEVEPTPVDEACHYCGAPVAVAYHEERLDVYCTECDGTYGGDAAPDWEEVPAEYGHLGALVVPPAGVRGRTPGEAFRAAWTWSNFEVLAMASGVCPRCSATVDHSMVVCEDHDAGDGVCERCDRRHAVAVSADCSNCNYGHWGGALLGVGAATPLLAFLLDHGVNPLSPEARTIRRHGRVEQDYEEELLATTPSRVRFRFSLAGEELAITVDEALNVVDVGE